MRNDTTRNSWTTNLFLITVTAAVTAGLMTLYDRYQHLKKGDASSKQNTGTQTDPVETPQDRPATQPRHVFHIKTTTATKRFLGTGAARMRHTPPTLETLLSYINERPLVTMAKQPSPSARPDVVAPIAQSGKETTETLHTKSSGPVSPRGELPDSRVAELFGSRNSSYALLPSRVASVDEDLDSPITPNNSREPLREEIQRRRNELFAQVEEDRASSAGKNTVTQEPKGWFSSLLSWR